MKKREWIKPVYLLAGFINIIGIPFFTKIFSNDYLSQIDPSTFSKTGLIVIILWGLAYVAVANNYTKVPYVSLVFGIEKIFYGIVWIVWINNNISEIPTIFRNDAITGVFYSVYGINDLLFGFFFLYVFFLVNKKLDD